MISAALVHTYFFASLGFSASLPSAVVQSLSSPAERASPSTASMNVSATAQNLTGSYTPYNLRIFCLDGRDDPLVKYEACEKAAQRMPQSRERHVFANRADGLPSAVQMPLNYWNDDATCSIQVTLRKGEGPGQTDFYILRDTAYAVLSQCTRPRSRGGIATGFTSHGHFAIRIEPYKLSISCDRSQDPPYASCAEAADRMPVRYEEDTFGNTGDSRISVQLPQTFASRDGRCAITVDTTSPSLIAAEWGKIWNAATALNAKCTRAQSKGGKIIRLGDPGKLFVQIKDGPGHPLLSLPGASNLTDNSSTGSAATA